MTKPSVFFHLIIFLGVFLLISFSAVHADFQPQGSVPGFYCYRNSSSVVQSLQVLKNEYPGLVHLSAIGNSWEGQPIYVLKLTNQSINSNKPRLILLSGLRANAFAPVELSLRFAENLLAEYGDNTDSTWLLNYFELHLIVLANPDGRAQAEQQAMSGADITWQNNTHNACSSQNIGVRLNHNFSFNWRASDVGACDPAYAGQSAGSEPETQAIQTYLEDLASKPEPIMLLNLDSYQNEILSPYLSAPTADNPHLTDLNTLAEKIGYNTLSAPVRQGDTSHQPSYGTLVDYAYGTLGIPSLVFSMGDSLAGGYTSRCWYFEGDEFYKDHLIKRNIPALIRALKVSTNPYHQSYGPEIEFENVNQNNNSVIIEGSANDYTSWYDGADVFSQVKSVYYSIDLPPWHSQAVLYSVSNLSQDNNSNYISSFNVEINYSQLSIGHHQLFFQAWDTEADGNPSNPGLVSAIDFFVPYLLFIPLVNMN